LNSARLLSINQLKTTIMRTIKNEVKLTLGQSNSCIWNRRRRYR